MGAILTWASKVVQVVHPVVERRSSKHGSDLLVPQPICSIVGVGGIVLDPDGACSDSGCSRGSGTGITSTS